LFSFISINWRGRPLTDYQTVIETIAATSTSTGLAVEAVLDTGAYPTGVKISDRQVAAIPLRRYDFHSEWNYRIEPVSIPERVRDKPITLKRTM
jgi:DDE family transposase